MKSKLFILLSFTILILGFQNCSNDFQSVSTGVTKNLSESTPELVEVPSDVEKTPGLMETEFTEEIINPEPPSEPDIFSLTNVRAQNIGVYGVEVYWELSNFGTGVVEYGESTDYGSLSKAQLSFKFDIHKQTLSNLKPDTIYHYRVHSEDQQGQKIVSNDYTFKTEKEITPVMSDAGNLERFIPTVKGLKWDVIAYQPQGKIPSHPRIKKNITIDGVTGYRHRVDASLYGEAKDGKDPNGVLQIPSDNNIIDVDFSAYDWVGLRVLHYITGYHGREGKDLALYFGPGYGGDMANGSAGNRKYNRQIPESYVPEGTSKEPGVVNLMHPKTDSNGNYKRILATYSEEVNKKVPLYMNGLPQGYPLPDSYNGAYYGNIETGSKGPTPIKQWVTYDILIHRTRGYEVWENGKRILQSNYSGNKAPLKDWDSNKVLSLHSRHMFGGNPENLLPYRDVDEYWADFHIIGAKDSN